jgi:hypothetical protein
MIQNDDPQSSTTRSSAGFRVAAAVRRRLMEHDLIDELTAPDRPGGPR